mmetsp:Transcript_8729/g.12911  ORF Transcript_8729/g.12911 Transcript_8729/m.12911 type:complete len:160 (-) Transcript_8729:917-1396(-)
MFYKKRIKTKISLAPEYLGSDYQEHIRETLKAKIGTCSPKYGYIITLLNIDSFSGAQVTPEAQGAVTFNIEYTAIFMKIFKKETVQGTVNMVTENGISVTVGPWSIFVSSVNMQSLKYEGAQNAFVSADVTIGKNTDIFVRVMNSELKNNHFMSTGELL